MENKRALMPFFLLDIDDLKCSKLEQNSRLSVANREQRYIVNRYLTCYTNFTSKLDMSLDVLISGVSPLF